MHDSWLFKYSWKQKCAVNICKSHVSSYNCIWPTVILTSLEKNLIKFRMTPLPQINNKTKQKPQLCSALSGRAYWMARQQAASSSLSSLACQSPPLAVDLSLLDLLTTLCLGLPSFCCWAPSERWLNLCPGNPAFLQLQCQPGSSDTAAEQTDRTGSQSLFVHGPSHWGILGCVQSRLSASPPTSCQ